MKTENTALIGKKIGMTRIFDEDGKMIPVTIVEVPTVKVTKILTEERDGYTGVQVGYYEKKEKHLTKADIARLRKADIEENFSRFKEFRIDEISDLKVGSILSVDKFENITAVDVEGCAKGKGFQGAVKRWGAKTGRQTHGSHFHRRPGSLGQRTTPGRVFKNKHMPGHLGTQQVTVLNLAVVKILKDSNTIAIKGSIPGSRGSYLAIRPTIKQ